MAIKLDSKIIGQNMGPKWKALVDKYVNNMQRAGAATNALRKDIEKSQHGLVHADKFLEELENFATSPLGIERGGLNRSEKASKARLTEVAEGRAVIDQVNKEVKSLAHSMGQGWVVDHQSITPINTRVTALIAALQELKNQHKAREFGGRKNPTKKLARLGIDKNVEVEIDNKIKQLQTCRAYLKELDKVLLDGSAIDEKSLKTAIEAGKGNNGYDIQTDKINDASVLDGDGNLGEFVVMTNEEHNPRSKVQYHLGAVISKIVDGNWQPKPGTSQDEVEAINELYDQVINDPTAVVGSEGIENSIERQMHEVFSGKRPKARKSKTSKTVKIKTKVDLRKSKAQLAKLNAKKRRVKKALADNAVRTARETGTQGGTDAEDAKAAMRLKRLINQRLPAEVRRNMGRPALINRTGRFSNSVILESLVPSPAGMVGKYSYQYRPYETFENTGGKRWPVAYNPKPLITKSIRNLAIQHMETKLTLKRT